MIEGEGTPPPPSPLPPRRTVGFGEAFRFWLKLGFINFGGPTGQIAIMHEELVEKRGWISESRFLHALNYCMLLPGPEAQQLAIYVGWLLHRTLGGLVAGIFFVLPGALLMGVLSWLAATRGHVEWVAAIFYGLRAAVIAIVAVAVIRIGSKALKNGVMVAIAALAFVAIFAFHVPFPWIVLSAGVLGLVGARVRPDVFVLASGHGAAKAAPAAGAPEVVLHDDEPPPDHARPSLARSLRALLVGTFVWIAPLALVAWWRGRDDVLTQQGVFFSKAAMVTFGGAYAVLAYVQQAAVERFHWLVPGEMLDGLGLAESTPGPLILVTQYVGYVGAYRLHGDLAPALAGALGAAVTLWATFAPCFLWIFLGAPFIESTRRMKAFAAALATITASVVGVVLNLAVWLALHTLFATVDDRAFGPVRVPVPALASVDLFAAALALVAFVAMKRWKVGIIPVVLASAAIGLAWKLGVRASG
ncbi:MAG TPA: chromate efflux transporter [Planctomycetota bacterium]|nr:chromate efflux transporter [Planctomycetota bacterium]